MVGNWTLVVLVWCSNDKWAISVVCGFVCLLILRQGLMHPRLASNLLCSWQSLWTSSFLSLRWQVCATMLGVCWAVLGSEFWALCVLGKHCSTWAPTPVLRKIHLWKGSSRESSTVGCFRFHNLSCLPNLTFAHLFPQSTVIYGREEFDNIFLSIQGFTWLTSH